MNTLRIATVGDAAAMLDIYAPLIVETGITQETDIPPVEDFAKRITATLPQRPWLVCEIGGEMAGYAYAGNYRDRKGYQWCIEPSVYIHQRFHRHRVATALYSALFRIVKIQGFTNAYAVITLPNDKSISFHKQFGFSDFTIYRNVGYKLDRWHDVGWLYLQVNEHAPEMQDPIAFSMLDADTVEQILRESEQLIV